MRESLAQAIADERGDAQVLRAKGFAREADLLDHVLDRIASAGEEYLRWLSEPEAQLQSGLAARTLRRRWHDWYDSGVARYSAAGAREYLQIVIPHRPDVQAARARGRDLTRGAA